MSQSPSTQQSFEPRDPDFAAKVTASFSKQAFMQTLGARISEVKPGSVRIDLPYDETATQQHGYMHAAAVAAIADSASGYAALTLMPPETAVLTAEYKISLLNPAIGESFFAIGSVRKAGRTLSMCMADVFAVSAEGEKLIATLTATVMTVRGRNIKD